MSAKNYSEQMISNNCLTWMILQFTTNASKIIKKEDMIRYKKKSDINLHSWSERAEIIKMKQKIKGRVRVVDTKFTIVAIDNRMMLIISETDCTLIYSGKT